MTKRHVLLDDTEPNAETIAMKEQALETARQWKSEVMDFDSIPDTMFNLLAYFNAAQAFMNWAAEAVGILEENGYYFGTEPTGEREMN